MAKYNLPTFKTLRPEVQKALSAWHAAGEPPNSLLSQLLLVRKARRALGVATNDPYLMRLATNQVLEAALKGMKKKYPTEAQLLYDRYVDERDVDELHDAYDKPTRHTLNHFRAYAVDQLTNVLLGQETLEYHQLLEKLLTTTPGLPEHPLVGIEHAISTLLDKLLDPDAVSLFALAGIGGIGKTATALALIREVAETFYYADIFWLSVAPLGMSGRHNTPQQVFESLIIDIYQKLWPDADAGALPEQLIPLIRSKLRTQPHLIVIDNLESKAEVAYLLPRLRELANPTRFLLTTRTVTQGTTSIFTYNLNQLPLKDATALVRFLIDSGGASGQVDVTDSDMEDIYTQVGGNPLALILIVSLIRILPLARILADLRQTQSKEIEVMYRHIYQHAWNTISDPARDLLFLMDSVGATGVSPNHLQEASEQEDSIFWPALTELINRSLLEVRGGTHARKYSTHSLTLSFLRNTIIQSIMSPE